MVISVRISPDPEILINGAGLYTTQVFYDVGETVEIGTRAKKKDIVKSKYYTAFVVGGLNVNRHQL